MSIGERPAVNTVDRGDTLKERRTKGNNAPSDRPRAFALSLDPDLDLPAHLFPFGEDRTAEHRVRALARGLASSPAWATMERAVLVVRTAPPPGLAVIGEVTEEDVVRLQRLPGQIRESVRQLRFVDYAGAEDAS
jgi:hypothetical protein